MSGEKISFNDEDMKKDNTGIAVCTKCSWMGSPNEEHDCSKFPEQTYHKTYPRYDENNSYNYIEKFKLDFGIALAKAFEGSDHPILIEERENIANIRKNLESFKEKLTN